MEEVAPRLFPRDDVHRVRQRALGVLRARGETVRAGWSALRWGEAEALAVAARALVRDTLGALPTDTAERWLAGAGDGPAHDAADAADLELLRLAVRHARRPTDPTLDGEIDALARRYADRGDAEGRSVALALATVVAHFRGDLERLVELAGRVRALPGAERERLLRFLVGAVDAALHALQGDAGAALDAIESLPRTGVEARTGELVTRLQIAMLLLAGRADEAAGVAEAHLGQVSSAYVR